MQWGGNRYHSLPFHPPHSLPTLAIHAAFQADKGQLTSRLEMISFLTKQADFKVEPYRLLQPLTLSHSQLQLLRTDTLQIP